MPSCVCTICRLTRQDVWEHLTAGRIKMPLDRSFPLDQVSDALEYAKANRHFGKITIAV